MYWNNCATIFSLGLSSWIVTLDVLKYNSFSVVPVVYICWIVTLDVLKLAYNCDRFACTLLNSNIRCIEMTAELFKIMLESSWIVTLDVLKSWSINWPKG